MSAGGKVSFGHQSDEELSGGQRLGEGVRREVGPGGGLQPVGGGRGLDQAVVGAAARRAQARFIGPPGHGGRVYRLAGEAGDHHGHGGGTAAVSADVIRPIGGGGPGLLSLIEVDDLHIAACEDILPTSLDKLCNGGVLSGPGILQSRGACQLLHRDLLLFGRGGDALDSFLQ